MYLLALGRKGRKNTRYIPPEKCQVYLLLLSQLVQNYTRLHNIGSLHGRDSVSTSEEDLHESMDARVMMGIHSHVEKLKSHLHKITSGLQLTPLWKSRLENMKFM
jgi:hypothetical protein